MTEHPFYSRCVKLLKEDPACKELLSTQFDSFFSNYYDFLQQYQRPQKKTFFKKTLNSEIQKTIKALKKVLGMATRQQFKPEMIPSITQVMMALLHPLNAETIRSEAFEAYLQILKILGTDAEGYTKGFDKFVFDFSPFSTAGSTKDTNLQIDNDPEMRLQTGENPPQETSFVLGQVRQFINEMIRIPANTDFSVLFTWWNIFQKLILSAAYHRVATRLNIPDAPRGFDVPCPTELHTLIITFLMTIIKAQNVFLQLIKTKNSKDFFFEAYAQSSVAHIDQEQSYTFVLLFSQCLCKNSQVVENEDTNFMFIGVQALISMIGKIFMAQKMDVQKYQRTTNTTFDFLKLVFKILPVDQRKTMCQLFTDCADSPSYPTILYILFNTLISEQISDQELWKSIFGLSVSQRSLFVQTASYFISYLSFIMADQLLKFNYDDLLKSIDDANAFSNVFNGQSKEWHKLLTEMIKSDNRRQYFTKFQPPQQPPGPVLLMNLNPNLEIWIAIITATKEIDFSRIKDEKSRYEAFMITYSAIAPLLKFSRYFPHSLEYDIQLIIDQFLVWFLQNCSPSATNPNIINKCLITIYNIINNRNSLPLLSTEVIGTWFLTLKHHLVSDNLEIRQQALKYSVLTLKLSFSGAEVLYEPIIASIRQGTSLLTEYFPSLAYSIDTCQEIFDKIEESSRMSTIMISIIENVYSNKPEPIEFKIKLAIELLKSFTPQQLHIFSVITFLLKDLEKVRPNSIEFILDSLFDIVESQGEEALQTNVYLLYVQLIADIIIISNSQLGLRRFTALSKNWTNLDLQYTILYLALHYHNNPVIPLLRPEDLPENDRYLFAKRDDIVLLLSSNRINTIMPTGEYSWAFEGYPIHPDPDKIIIDFPVERKDSKPQDPIEYEQQKSFMNSATTFLDNLYTEKLHSSLCKPTDYKIEPFSFEPNEKTEYSEHKTIDKNQPPLTYGANPAAFVSSLGFYDKFFDERLYPLNQNANQEFVNLDTNKFRHSINISILAPENPSTHFTDFKAGLGFIDEETGNIVYSDCRHQFVFHNSTEKLYQIRVIWNENLDSSVWLSQFDENHLVHISIKPTQNGMFSISIYLNRTIFKQIHLLPSVKVSQHTLPVFILAQIFIVVHLLDACKNETHFNKILASGQKLKEQSSNDFASTAIPLAVDKTFYCKPIPPPAKVEKEQVPRPRGPITNRRKGSLDSVGGASRAGSLQGARKSALESARRGSLDSIPDNV